VVDKKYVFGLALNRSRHALPMAWAWNQRLQDEEVESAL
jgi:hypothetical protein